MAHVDDKYDPWFTGKDNDKAFLELEFPHTELKGVKIVFNKFHETSEINGIGVYSI